jgi:cytochrome c2
MVLPIACGHEDSIITAQMLAGGNVKRGQQLIYSYNCGSCHTIPGVAEANGKIGPTLGKIAGRVYVAGLLVNTPENLSRWISGPQEIHPQTAMPDLGVTKKQADDIVAYLYTLR